MRGFKNFKGSDARCPSIHFLFYAIECLWIEILLKSAKSFIVGCFYCPPKTSNYHQSNFNDLLQDHLRIVDKEFKTKKLY